MVLYQKLFHLNENLLQIISKTRENIGEILKLQKQHSEMNHKVSEGSICLQNEVKGILEDIRNDKDIKSMKRHSFD